MKKRGEYTTIEEYVLALTGTSLQELNNYKKWDVKGLDKIAMFLIDMSKRGDKRPVFVYADADCDGINSADELIRLLKRVMGLNLQTYIPLKFTDGYGITTRFVERLPQGCVLITIDNGIAAIEPLALATAKNITTIIMDHHLTTESGIIPKASLIVDPEAFPNTVSTGFDQLCAGGLAYELTLKVAELAPELFGTTDALEAFLDEQVVYAANATAGDSMALLHENRRIMQLGLEVIHKHKAPYTINKLIELNGNSTVENYCSKDMSFDLAPKTNATARLEDAGARKTAMWLLKTGVVGDEVAALITNNNTLRKKITSEATKEMHFDESAPINFVCLENKEQYRGLFGLMAGKCVELNGKPSFICGTTKDGRVVGSARSKDGEKNNVKKMIDFCKDIPMTGGGHPAAAGYSFDKKDIKRVFDRLCEYPVVKMTAEDLEMKWDLPLNAAEAADVRTKLDMAEPFGKDFEAPVFMLSVETAEISYMKDVHVKLRNVNGTFLDALIFYRADDFKAHGESTRCNLYGTLTWNEYKGIKKARFIADAVEFAA